MLVNAYIENRQNEAWIHVENSTLTIFEGNVFWNKLFTLENNFILNVLIYNNLNSTVLFNFKFKCEK